MTRAEQYHRLHSHDGPWDFIVIGGGATGAGVAIDLVRVSGLGRLMRSTLYGIDTLDVASFAIVAILLMGVAGLASWLPPRRSARVDPMVALRSE